ncbi:hypothetical protein QFZ78_005800 [Paenibacillus sp. V4I5]|nr:hypothetical protein [Paenibacillus sp. V4I5]
MSYSAADGKLRMDRNHSGTGEAGVSEMDLASLLWKD